MGRLVFNNRRMFEPIGNVPPAEAEADYYAALDQIAQAAQLNQSASGKLGAVQTANTREPSRKR